MVTPTEGPVLPSPSPLLSLLYLSSPTLPVGAYAYSQGLEAAVAQGYVCDAPSAQEWVRDLLSEVLAAVDVPIFARLYAAWCRDDACALAQWSDELLAQRESRELQDEDLALGRALARLLRDLGHPRARALLDDAPAAALRPTWAGAFALASVEWSIPLEDAAHAYLYTWAENQIAAATRLIPLGQTAARRALREILCDVPRVVHAGLALGDPEIGAAAPGLALLASSHETQYTRLFRS